MREDLIDIVNAEDVQVGDYVRLDSFEGEIVRVEEADELHVVLTNDNDEEIVVRWDRMVNLYGNIVEEI